MSRRNKYLIAADFPCACFDYTPTRTSTYSDRNLIQTRFYNTPLDGEFGKTLIKIAATFSTNKFTPGDLGKLSLKILAPQCAPQKSSGALGMQWENIIGWYVSEIWNFHGVYVNGFEIEEFSHCLSEIPDLCVTWVFATTDLPKLPSLGI